VASAISPDLRQLNPVAQMGMPRGLLAVIAKVTVRRRWRTEPAIRIVFYFALVGTLESALPLAWARRTPSAAGLLGAAPPAEQSKMG